MIDESKLRPWQVEPTKHLLEILRHYDSALDASQTGVGKSFVALAIAKELQLPTLVIAPKIALTAWRSVSEHFAEPVSIINYELLSKGNSPFGTWSDSQKVRPGRSAFLLCLFCRCRVKEGDPIPPCSAHHGGVHCYEYHKKPRVYGNFLWNPAVRFLIVDEVQRCSGMDSLNSKMLIAAKRQKIKTLLLSATPFDSILKAKAIGFSLDLFTI